MANVLSKRITEDLETHLPRHPDLGVVSMDKNLNRPERDEYCQFTVTLTITQHGQVIRDAIEWALSDSGVLMDEVGMRITENGIAGGWRIRDVDEITMMSATHLAPSDTLMITIQTSREMPLNPKARN